MLKTSSFRLPNQQQPPLAAAILKVLVDPSMPGLDRVVTGSVVMVMGTVVKAAVGGIGVNPTLSSPSAEAAEDNDDEEDDDDGALLSHIPIKVETVPSPRSHPAQEEEYQIEARILRVLSSQERRGVDLTLFRNALHTRRKAIFQRYHSTYTTTSTSSFQEEEDHRLKGGSNKNNNDSNSNHHTVTMILEQQQQQHPLNHKDHHDESENAAGTYHELPQQQQNQQEQIPIPGCGPPPYHSFAF
jgi:hypothetical protein